MDKLQKYINCDHRPWILAGVKDRNKLRSIIKASICTRRQVETINNEDGSGIPTRQVMLFVLG